jgi:hypothetical protein
VSTLRLLVTAGQLHLLYSMANGGIHIQRTIANRTWNELQSLPGDQSNQPYYIYAGGNKSLYVGILNHQYERDFCRIIGINLESTSSATKFVRHHGLARNPIPQLENLDAKQRSLFIAARLGEVALRPSSASLINVFQCCVLRTNRLNEY